MTLIANARHAEIVAAIEDIALRTREFTTIDVIKRISGAFFSDRDTAAALSPNALFGKRLSAHAARFRIQRIGRLHATDDGGNRTTTAQWRAT